MSSRRFWILVGGAALAIMLGCWLSSGTMAPYGTTTEFYGASDSYIDKCGFRMNGDHWHFHALFKMIDGRPKAEWQDAFLLRRVLYAVLAYPFMKVLGFEAGGIAFNVLLHGAMLIAFAVAMRRYFDARAAVLTCWLLATFPGYAYWAGVPYVYAFIVPGSIACMIALLWWNDRPSLRRSAVAACVVGVVALGYDLMPFFGLGLLLMIAHRRRWRDLAVACGILAAFAAFIAIGLPAIYGVPAGNPNTDVYGRILAAYLDAPNRLDGWPTLLARLPKYFVLNFFYCNMLLFPALLLWLAAIRLRWRIRPVLGPIVVTILLATLVLFLFLNLSPPYPGRWQMRGSWLSRLYQPSFVVVLVLVASTSVALREQLRRYRIFLWSVVAVVAIDAVVIFGPYVGIDSLYAAVYERFYIHESLRHNHEWISKWGTRPYGICPASVRSATQ